MIPAEEDMLHVPGNQRLVEIPNAGDDVLGEKLRGHREPAIRTSPAHLRETLFVPWTGAFWQD
jgi:hypothetical protein